MNPSPAAGEPVLVVVPTYNERDNLAPLLDRLHTALPRVHALVVDDASPDGTGRLAAEHAAADERVHVLHRARKDGLGAAYVDGFRWGLDRDYAALVAMDADGSHAPEQLPRLLGELDGHALVLGSRYVTGGAVVNWPRGRKLLSKAGNLYSALALGVRLRDVTGGFRAYRREVLEHLGPETIAAQGYCFQVDLAWRSVRAGFPVTEVPITFVERVHGESKMNAAIVREAMVKVAAWGLRYRGAQVRRKLAALAPGG